MTAVLRFLKFSLKKVVLRLQFMFNKLRNSLTKIQKQF
jgi:hypothetical protein